MKKISSLNFFPHDPESLLTNQDMKLKILKLTLFFVNQCINAIDSFFIKKTYSDFDAHVGDTLCQIRAYKILMMVKYFKENPAANYYAEEYKNLQLIKEKTEEKIFFFHDLIEKKKPRYNKILDEHETLHKFINMYGLAFEITEATSYLTQSIILTKYSQRISFSVSIAMEYKKLMEHAEISKTTAYKILKNFQSTLAKQSCEFVRSLFNEIPEQLNLSINLQRLETDDPHKRRVLPCYEVTKIILLHMRLTQTPILLVTHKEKNGTIEKPIPNLFFFSKEKNEFEPFPNNHTISLETPCLIIHGTTQSDAINSIIKVGLSTVILSNMATHPQFYSKTPETTKRELELIEMKHLAESLGYCRENPMLFFLKHIYSDSLKNELVRLNSYNHIRSYSLAA